MVSEPVMVSPFHATAIQNPLDQKTNSHKETMQWIKEAMSYLIRAKFGGDIPLTKGIPVKTREELLGIESESLQVLQTQPSEPLPDLRLEHDENMMEILVEENQESNLFLENFVEHVVCDQIQETAAEETSWHPFHKQSMRIKRIPVRKNYRKARFKTSKRRLWEERLRIAIETQKLTRSLKNQDKVTFIESVSDLQKLRYVAVDDYPCEPHIDLSEDSGCAHLGLNKGDKILMIADGMEGRFSKVSHGSSFASKVNGVLARSRSNFQHKLKECGISTMQGILSKKKVKNKRILLLVDSMDSSSFYKEESFGAYSPLLGLVALLGVVDEFSNFQRQLVFFIMTGETWGYWSNMRVLHELYLPSDAGADLSGTPINMWLEIRSIGKGLKGEMNNCFAQWQVSVVDASCRDMAVAATEGSGKIQFMYWLLLQLLLDIANTHENINKAENGLDVVAAQEAGYEEYSKVHLKTGLHDEYMIQKLLPSYNSSEMQQISNFHECGLGLKWRMNNSDLPGAKDFENAIARRMEPFLMSRCEYDVGLMYQMELQSVIWHDFLKFCHVYGNGIEKLKLLFSSGFVDEGIGKKQDFTISSASTWPKDEGHQMVQETERFAKDNEGKRDTVDTKNQTDSMVYPTEKELGEKNPSQEKETVETKLQELKDKIRGVSTCVPAVQEIVKKLTGEESKVTMNFVEVVALGALLQFCVMVGDVSDMLLLDVIPLSMGLGGVRTKIISRNTMLSISKSVVSLNVANGQTSVEFNGLQDEREFVKDNTPLGSFWLDGVLYVTVVDKGEVKKVEILQEENTAKVTPPSNLVYKFSLKDGWDHVKHVREIWETSGNLIVHKIKDMNEKIFLETDSASTYKEIRICPSFSLSDLLQKFRKLSDRQHRFSYVGVSCMILLIRTLFNPKFWWSSTSDYLLSLVEKMISGNKSMMVSKYATSLHLEDKMFSWGEY